MSSANSSVGVYARRMCRFEIVMFFDVLNCKTFLRLDFKIESCLLKNEINVRAWRNIKFIKVERKT
jgi:hypothetical protein